MPNHEKEVMLKREEYYQKGDTIKIINYKFPETHSNREEDRSFTLEPDRLNQLYDQYKKQEDPDLSFSKKITFHYQNKAVNYLGMIGTIVGIRTIAECEYEIRTNDMAIYIVRIISDKSGWADKKMTLYPSQVIRINKKDSIL